MARIQQIDQVYVDVRQSASVLDALRQQAGSATPELSVDILGSDGKPLGLRGRILFSGIEVDAGTGDVLLSYENEALFAERNGDPVEHVTPPSTFKIENPVAVVTSGPHQDKANALKNFLYTADGQKLWAQAGFRPVDPAVTAEFAKDFPTPEKLWTIADLGGWKTVDPALFDKENGSITKIYKQATG